MKPTQNVTLLLTALTLLGATAQMGLSSMSSSSSAGASGQAAAPEAKTPVNIITENQTDTKGAEMQDFLDKLSKRETIMQIRQTINALDDRLNDIQTQIKNRLNVIDSTGSLG